MDPGIGGGILPRLKKKFPAPEMDAIFELVTCKASGPVVSHFAE